MIVKSPSKTASIAIANGNEIRFDAFAASYRLRSAVMALYYYNEPEHVLAREQDRIIGLR